MFICFYYLPEQNRHKNFNLGLARCILANQKVVQNLTGPLIIARDFMLCRVMASGCYVYMIRFGARKRAYNLVKFFQKAPSKVILHSLQAKKKSAYKHGCMFSSHLAGQ